MNLFKNKKLIQLLLLKILLFIYNPSTYSQRYFEFGCVGYDSTENFIAATTDTIQLSIADSLLFLPDSLRGRHIHGLVAFGNDGYNLNWNWHFIPNKWQLVETSVELCDTRPSAIRNDSSYWDDTLLVCPWCTYIIREIFPLSVKDKNKYSSEQSIMIYPNPNYGIFSVNIPTRRYENVTLKVFNILGQLLYIATFSNPVFQFTERFNITHLSSGIYFVQLSLGNQTVIKKLIKR
jgi:hypothetical protein